MTPEEADELVLLTGINAHQFVNGKDGDDDFEAFFASAPVEGDLELLTQLSPLLRAFWRAAFVAGARYGADLIVKSARKEREHWTVGVIGRPNGGHKPGGEGIPGCPGCMAEGGPPGRRG